MSVYARFTYLVTLGKAVEDSLGNGFPDLLIDAAFGLFFRVRLAEAFSEDTFAHSTIHLSVH